MVSTSAGHGVASSGEHSVATPWVLDRMRSSISVPVNGSEQALKVAKFVEVDVASASNPNRYALSFEVSFQSKEGTKSVLGNFSLYPADNPGRFIVPSQGKLRRGGIVQVSMKVLDAPEFASPVSVTIGAIHFVQK
jgi:hypothetical protein